MQTFPLLFPKTTKPEAPSGVSGFSQKLIKPRTSKILLSLPQAFDLCPIGGYYAK